MTEPEQPVSSAGGDPAEPRRRSMEDRIPPALWVRVLIYVAVGHLFAAFVYLLFTLGGQSR